MGKAEKIKKIKKEIKAIDDFIKGTRIKCKDGKKRTIDEYTKHKKHKKHKKEK